MTPKEKAKELVDKFLNLYTGITLGIAKRSWAKSSALISVDEILDINSVDKDYDLSNYWQEVKQEIEKL
jgi:hypothetical protein